jgi:hypothetical protein
LGALSIVATVFAGNFLFAERHAFSALNADSRHQGISIWAYYRFGLVPTSMVVDVRSFEEGKLSIDVIRVLYQIAERMKDREFNEIRLAYRGHTRFLLDAKYFHRIGQEYAFQDPVYTIQNLPEHLYLPAGTRAFDNSSGERLGVMTPMQDFSTFIEAWFLRDERLRSNTSLPRSEGCQRGKPSERFTADTRQYQRMMVAVRC